MRPSEGEPPGDGSRSIRIIVCPTCDRLESLRRTVRTFGAHCRRRQPPTRFIVADDTRPAGTRRECRAMLRALARETGLEISYAGFEEKALFAKRLVREGAADPEVLKFAFFDPEGTGIVTTGANYNALFLETAGELIASVDDDTVGRIGRIKAAPPAPEGMAVESDLPFAVAHPQQVWVMSDWNEADSAVEETDENYLDLHEQLLGRPLAELPALAGGASAPPPGKVYVTMHGLVGDCGWASPSLFFLLTGPSLQRIAQDGDFKALARRRMMLKAVERPTLVRGCTNMMCMFFGFDNRGLAPPCLPMGRGQDHIFGITVSVLHPDSWFGYLPRLVPHLPLEPRIFWPGETARSASGIDIAFLVGLLMREWARTEGAGAPGREYERCGRFLQEMGTASPRSFLAEIQRIVGRQIDLLLQLLEERSRAVEDGTGWKSELAPFMESLREQAAQEGFAVPLDCRVGHGGSGPPRSSTEALEVSARIVTKFGRLIEWWPQGREAARALRQRGITISQPL